MNSYPLEHRDPGFLIGLLTGTFVGATLAMWFAPRLASELRGRPTDSAKRLRQRASQQYQQAAVRVGETVDEVSRSGVDVPNDVVDAVARGAREVERGAHEVERFAMAARSRKE